MRKLPNGLGLLTVYSEPMATPSFGPKGEGDDDCEIAIAAEVKEQARYQTAVARNGCEAAGQLAAFGMG